MPRVSPPRSSRDRVVALSASFFLGETFSARFVAACVRTSVLLSLQTGAPDATRSGPGGNDRCQRSSDLPSLASTWSRHVASAYS